MEEGLTELSERIAAERPGLRIVDGDRVVRADELPARVAEVAAGMHAAGIGPGDHVAVFMRNRIEWLEAWFAIARLGAVIVPLNTRFSTAEVEYVLQHGQASWLIWHPGDGAAVDAEQIAAIEANGVKLRGRIVHGGEPAAAHEHSWDTLLGQGQEAPNVEDPAGFGMIQFTSGSTAFPKGAMLRNGTLVRNGKGLGDAWQISSKDRILCSNPLFHNGGSVFAFLSAFTHAADIVMLPGWKITEATALIDAEQITVLPLIDAALRDIVAHAHSAGHPYESVRLVSTAADRTLFERAVATVHCEVSNIYGLTESHPNVCVGDLADDLERRLSYIGRPQPGIELAIGDPETSVRLPAGESGEILVRGWSVMNGYWNDEGATERAFTDDGFLRTGDLGRLDADGYLEYVGRAKLMIKSGGENIAIEEVETAIRRHPDVADVVVVPVPHPRFVEVGYAYLKPHDGATIDPDEVIARARDLISPFKLPKFTEVVDDLPRTGSGKIDRVGLAQQARETNEGVVSDPV
jgi:fatty-acyl-CoA synthase